MLFVATRAFVTLGAVLTPGNMWQNTGEDAWMAAHFAHASVESNGDHGNNGDKAGSKDTKSGAGTGSLPPDDDDDGFDNEPKKRGEKGRTFRGGKKSERDNWYGQNDKNFQKWWHREGKAEFNGGRDIQDSQNAKDAMQYWKGIGKPIPK